MHPWTPVLGITFALLGGSDQTGTVYRFRTGSASGTVWVADDEARLETDPGAGAETGSKVSIWKAGGRQLLVLNDRERTYFDRVAYRTSRGFAAMSLDTLNVKDPFVIAEVQNIRVDLQALPPGASSPASADDCRRVSLTFSYDLSLRLKTVDASFPGRVAGSGEFCLVDSLPISKLPFDHGLEIVSGIPKVDAVFAERLATLKGFPIHRTLTAKRLIEGGEEVTATATLALSEFRATVIAPGRLDVPHEYRYQEPVIVGPVRQNR